MIKWIGLEKEKKELISENKLKSKKLTKYNNKNLEYEGTMFSNQEQGRGEERRGEERKKVLKME